MAIVGPTACGKTAAASVLARRIGSEIISADSMAIYRGMNIGTAKPTEDERRGVTFHLIDVVEPDEPFTVADFQERAVAVIDDLLGRNKAPLIVGGTGLYVRAVLDGLNIPGPGPNPELRERLRKVALENGSELLHMRLREVDSESAARLHPNDTKRIIRALEVYEQTGAPMSELIRETRAEESRYPDALRFGLTMDRGRLYRRIEDRVDQLIRDGLVEEVAGLIRARITNPAEQSSANSAQQSFVDCPAMQGLGYKEIVGHLEGKYDLGEAIELIKMGTRRFAKRQYTWFRADERIDWIEIDELSAEEVADRLEAKLVRAGVLGQDVG